MSSIEDNRAGLEAITNAEPTEHTTDLGNARRFVAQHGAEVRYCHAWRSWLVWDGARWRTDDTAEIQRRGKETVVSIYGEAERAGDSATRELLAKHAARSEAERCIRAMLNLAESEPGIPVRPDDLDAHPFLLSCPNGTLDLRTGALRPAHPADLLTRGTDIPYDPDADCPRWLAFLEQISAGDGGLVAFLHRLTGYSITGDVSEHALAVLHGSGCNGKTTYVEIVKQLLGELAATAAFDTFSRVRGSRGPREDLARLHRKRIVCASESGEGRRLDEATVKSCTGGDTVTARFLYGEHFEFTPEFKLWLVTNHRPRVDGDDDAIWRRLRLIPFEESFEGRIDKRLPQTLAAELPGILRWAVEGCLRWQDEGLGRAEAVERATREYRADEDVLGAFLDERCALGGETPTGEFRAAYEEFCAEWGEKSLPSSVLGRRLAKRGIKRGGHGRKSYQGASLR